jgi:hypothetical protein
MIDQLHKVCDQSIGWYLEVITLRRLRFLGRLVSEAREAAQSNCDLLLLGAWKQATQFFRVLDK